MSSRPGDVNAANQYRITPLAVAAEQGHLDIVNMLVAAGAKVNARDTAGGTALSVAILRGYKEIVEALLAAGTDVLRDKEDLLNLAADKPEIKEMLEKAFGRARGNDDHPRSQNAQHVAQAKVFVF